MATLAETDPARAFALLISPRGQAGANPAFDQAANEVLHRWALRDPLAAIQATASFEGQSGSVPARRLGNLAQEAIYEGWAAHDPAGLLAYIKSGAKVEYDLKGMAGWLVPALLNTDPKAAAEVLEACTGSTYMLASRWTESDPLAALAWAETQPGDSRAALDVKLHAARNLATADPDKAIGLLREYQPRADPQQDFWLRESYREAFNSLTAADPDKARQMITSDPELAKAGAMNGYMANLFAKDPAAALTQAAEWLQDPALAGSVAGAISMAYSVSNGAPPRDFSPVLAALPELAAGVDSETMRGWARAAPESAAEFLAARAAQGKPVADLKPEGVLSEIATARPEWTSQWLTTLPEGQLRQDAAESLVANWSAFDPEAAKAWFDSLSAGPSRDAAAKAWEHRLEVEKNPYTPED